MNKWKVAFIGLAIVVALYVAYNFGLEKGTNDNYSSSQKYNASVSSKLNYSNKSDSSNTESNKTESVKYILNKKTKKIHVPTCSSVSQMNDSNKVKSNEDINSLLDSGYSKCQNCHPK